MAEEYVGPERRYFKRLAVTLPAYFLFINTESKKELARIRRGYTKDISGGGMLLEMSDLSEEMIKGLTSGMVRVGLEFKVPSSKEPVRTLARVAWLTVRKELEPHENRYLLGLNFVDITEKDRDKILNFVVTSYLKKIEEKFKDTH